MMRRQAAVGNRCAISIPASDADSAGSALLSTESEPNSHDAVDQDALTAPEDAGPDIRAT
jgi:hypothetical protein